MKACPKCAFINGHDSYRNCHPVLSIVMPVIFALIVTAPFVVGAFVLGPWSFLSVILDVILYGGNCGTSLPGPPC